MAQHILYTVQHILNCTWSDHTSTSDYTAHICHPSITRCIHTSITLEYLTYHPLVLTYFDQVLECLTYHPLVLTYFDQVLEYLTYHPLVLTYFDHELVLTCIDQVLSYCTYLYYCRCAYIIYCTVYVQYSICSHLLVIKLPYLFLRLSYIL